MVTLQGTFGTKSEAGSRTQLTHPDDIRIIETAKNLLANTVTGMSLLQLMNAYSIPVKVIKGREPNFSVPDDKTVVLICPEKTPADLHEMAVNLGLGIRSVEHGMVGFKMPAQARGTQEAQNVLFSKTLDIVMTMCKLVSEFVDRGEATNLVELIEKLGHGDIYRANRSGASFQEMEALLKKAVTS
jgi:hypothetical protein